MSRLLNPLHALRQHRGGLLRSLPRRAWLTLKYLGPRAFLWRALTFPLRFTPLAERLGYGVRFGPEYARALRWYGRQGRPVTVVIPTYGDPGLVFDAVKSVRRTVDRKRVRIVVVDDGSAPQHRQRLLKLRGAEVILGERTAGFAGNANRGLRAAGPQDDMVLLNSDTVAERGWLECLQYAAYADRGAGVVGPKLLYGDGRIQSAGSQRNLPAPEWFDHRYRFRPAHHGPANVTAPVLGVTGACMYVKREALDRLGPLDEGYPMAYEDMDYCLRTWEAGFSVIYYPHSTLTHLESQTRTRDAGEPELASQRRFWRKWGDWLDSREVRTPDGRLRVIYVTQDTGLGGGHRVVFEHLNGLRARGHEVELYSLDGPPGWFDLRAPVRRFRSYPELAAALASEDAIKVATWWETAEWVWRAAVRRGIAAYFVQDIESSYYPDDPAARDRVIAGYRQEHHFLTTSPWNRDQLGELGFEAALVPPGVDGRTYRPLGRERHPNALLAVGRSHRLKNLGLTIDAWRALPAPRPELWLFGIEPELGARHGARYFEAPSDERVNELLNTATVFVQTSRHEGFCLPLLEAMAAGTPVVCTDAHGNRGFCEDGVNCLLVEDDSGAVARGIATLLGDEDLRGRLSEAGLRTAREHGWEAATERLEAFYERLAASGGAAALQPAEAPANPGIPAAR